MCGGVACGGAVLRVSGGRRVGRSRRKEGGSIPSSSTFFSRSTSHQNQHDHDEPRTVGTSRGITRRDVEEQEEDSGADGGEVERLSKNGASSSRVREVQVQRKRVRKMQGEGRLGCRRDDDRVDRAKESEEEGGAQCHQDEGESDGGSRKE